MVSLITEGSAFDAKGRPFKRRNYLPGLVALAVLALLTTVVWAIALSQTEEVAVATPCNPPPPPADGTPAVPLGEQVPRSTMVDVMPARLLDTKVRVLNASGEGGQAAEVAGSLKEMGFAPPTAANDDRYANSRLNCQGQIRFGATGQAAAATVWTVAPCFELIRDDRPDDTVDLALGTQFEALADSDDVDAVLAALAPESATPVDPALIRDIHSSPC
ncbi:envelope integrity protein Cei [Mycobacterium sp. MYCO198283]|uniref:envelope integrity protein Cei n=1 Tax=Mycobacterium sp. MYCO198283 TaxID=2883505 RepID=UPI001E3565E5|nr:envelope integrity protein Cei [Mycobacterium sp. MYCO198283]MCG5433898.1 envelope integrity protein Cei [Mycobacterium sp. MYCO198283]